MVSLGTPPLLKIFVSESFDKLRKRNHGNLKENKTKCGWNSAAGHTDVLIIFSSHLLFYDVLIFIKTKVENGLFTGTFCRY